MDFNRLTLALLFESALIAVSHCLIRRSHRIVGNRRGHRLDEGQRSHLLPYNL